MRQIGREEAEFLREMHTTSLEGHVRYIDCSFSVRTNVVCQKFLFFFIVGCLGSVISQLSR